ncbi:MULTISPECIES: HAD family hydrolase [Bacillaceae]|uniref:HAD-IB family hydrolase n=1 Tax=Evansella alkalicola TaxID=745819 RepID=A0ABS6JXL9_9BACI|nr:HAD-IB family hydrolase [Litchfieldia alkalitelluris]MBU9723338.1 HAD-IB family hydrolase [Bacillus alkalicola]
MKIAIVDFDGTLYPNETFALMMRHLKEHPVHSKRYRFFMARMLPVYTAYKCKLYPEAKMREYSMRTFIASFGDTAEEEVRLFFSELGKTMRDQLNTKMIERIVKHMQDGYTIMIVSGAYDLLLHAVTEDLEIDTIVGTNIPFKNEKVDNSTPVIHINGLKKQEKIYECIDKDSVDWENSYAYGDSYSDLPVLELVGNPVAVNPDSRLQEVAQDKKWDIL